MESNKIENQLIENEKDIRKFGKKKNKNNINHCFIILPILFLITSFSALIYYLINYKKNSYDSIEKSSYDSVKNALIEKALDEYLFSKASDKNNTFKISIKNYNNYIEVDANYEKINSEGEYERKIYLNELIFNSVWDTVTKAYKQIVFEIKKDTTKKLLIENKYYINIIIPVDYEYYKQMNLTIPRKLKTNINTFQNLIYEMKILNEKI